MTDDHHLDAAQLREIYRHADGSREGKVAMVAMVVAEIREGVRKPASFVDRPPTLPDTPAQLRKLLESTAAADQDMRRELLLWNADNHAAALDTAAGLRTIAQAVELIDELVSKGGTDDENGRLWGERKELVTYAQLVFHADLTKAPRDHEALWNWCYARARRLDPCRDERLADKGRPSFEAARARAKEHVRAQSIARTRSDTESEY